MFDPKVSNNTLPLLPLAGLDSIHLLKLVNEANKQVSKLNGIIQTLPNFEMLVAPLNVREAVASSQIENIHTTVSEVFQAELFPNNQSYAEKETLGYRDGIMVGFDFIRKFQFLSINTIVSIQKTVEPNKNYIRRTQNYIRSGSEIIYTPPSAEVLPGFLSNFEQYINSVPDHDELIQTAVSHFQFEAIHPFLDGNGRTGRILMVMQLLLRNSLDYPILYLSGYINEHRPEYYNLLRITQRTGNIVPWCEFMVLAIGEQAKQTLFTLEQIKTWRRDSEKILEQHFGKKYPHVLLEYLLSKPLYTIEDLIKNTSVSRVTATRYLEILAKRLFLKKTKKGRVLIYSSEELLSILS